MSKTGQMIFYSIIFIFAAVTAVYTPLVAVISTAVMTLCFVKLWHNSPVLAVVFPILTAGFAYFVYGSFFASAFYLCIFLPLASCIIFMMHKRCNFKDIVIVSGVFSAICMIFLGIVFVAVRTGSFSQANLETAIGPYVKRAISGVVPVGNDPLTQYIDKINSESIENFIKAKNTLIGYLPETLLSFFTVNGLLCLLFIKRSGSKEKDMSYMGSFEEFTMSRAATLMMLICFIAGFFMGDSMYSIAFYNLYTYIMGLFAISGLAFILKLIRKMQFSIIIKGFAIVSGFMMIALGMTSMLAFVGVLGSIFKYKKRG